MSTSGEQKLCPGYLRISPFIAVTSCRKEYNSTVQGSTSAGSAVPRTCCRHVCIWQRRSAWAHGLLQVSRHASCSRVCAEADPAPLTARAPLRRCVWIYLGPTHVDRCLLMTMLSQVECMVCVACRAVGIWWPQDDPTSATVCFSVWRVTEYRYLQSFLKAMVPSPPPSLPRGLISSFIVYGPCSCGPDVPM